MGRGSFWGHVLSGKGGGLVYSCGGVHRGQSRGHRVLTSKREGEQVGLVVGVLWMGTWSCAESEGGSRG